MDPEIISEFVRESYDLLDNVEPTLIELSVSSDEGNISPDLINTTFRLFHSLKGNAGFLDFKSIASLTHEAETVLDLVRHNELDLNNDIMLVLCESMDLLRLMLDGIENTGSDKGFEDKVDDVSAKLKDVAGKEPESDSDSKDETAVEISEEMRDVFVKEGFEQVEAAEQAMLSFFPDDCDKSQRDNYINEAFRNIHSFKGNCGFMGLVQLENISHLLETVVDEIRAGHISSDSETQNITLKTLDILKDGVDDVRNGGSGTVGDYDISIMLLDSILPKRKASVVSKASKSSAKAEVSQSADSVVVQDEVKTAMPGSQAQRKDIRVDLTKLDSLINLIGELVIAEAMVTRCPAVIDIDDQYFDRSKDQLRRICEDLQDISMSIRMVPLSATFKKMIRLVHDLSLKAGKQIKLHISGESTEVDKTVIEQIGDPLVHIIRNSCDHGVETPEERVAAGKNPEGNVHIDAKHEGGEVWIVITDDGKGLGKERIVDKAISRGLINPDQMSSMKDSDIFNLIFEPGFSTADKITNISGRGVGMDVVRKNIESLNGKIDVDSREGQGTKFILRIPLTLAIIDGMLVRVGKACYVVPLLSIKESLRALDEQITTMPDGLEYFRLREEMIPVLRMHKLFNCSCDSENLSDGILIVVEDNNRTVAIFVDEILGQQQTVIKGISEYLGEAQFCSGCTILGDGTVSLILNMSTLVGNGILRLHAIENNIVEPSSNKKEQAELIESEPVEKTEDENVYINPKFSKKASDGAKTKSDIDLSDKKDNAVPSDSEKPDTSAADVKDEVFINPAFTAKKQSSSSSKQEKSVQADADNPNNDVKEIKSEKKQNPSEKKQQKKKANGKSPSRQKKEKKNVDGKKESVETDSSVNKKKPVKKRNKK